MYGTLSIVTRKLLVENCHHVENRSHTSKYIWIYALSAGGFGGTSISDEGVNRALSIPSLSCALNGCTPFGLCLLFGACIALLLAAGTFQS